jgi:hypothetical protein
MQVDWDEDGNLIISLDGCWDCCGEEYLLTPEELDELLAKRPERDNCKCCKHKGDTFNCREVVENEAAHDYGHELQGRK